MNMRVSIRGRPSRAVLASKAGTNITAVFLSFHPYQRRMHVLKGLLRLARLPQAGHVACATCLRLRQAFSRTLWSQKQ